MDDVLSRRRGILLQEKENRSTNLVFATIRKALSDENETFGKDTIIIHKDYR
jgi:hypothetical protein